MRRFNVWFVLLAIAASGSDVRAGGVEPDEIRVVLYNSWGVNGDMNEPPSRTDTAVVRSIKAHLDHFARNTDTFGRTVRVFGFDPGASSSGCASEEARADVIVDGFDPFAVGYLGIVRPRCAAARLADKHGVLSFVVSEGLTRKTFTDIAPFAWGYFPDRALDARLSASFVCRSLAGGLARAPFTKDPVLVGKERTFAIVAETGDHRATLLAHHLSRCDISIRPIRFGDGSRALTDRVWLARDAARIMSKLKKDGVTTLICYCGSSEATLSMMESAAAAIGYAPEWYWDDATSIALLDAHRRRRVDLGISHWWRQPADQDRPGMTSIDFSVSTTFWLMFTSFHRAGPDLSVATLETGLRSFASRPADNPFVPGGGFDDEMGPTTFIDTALAWWSDPVGTPPGGRPGEGCFRVADQGLRYSVDTWPSGDGWLGTPGSPCATLRPR